MDVNCDLSGGSNSSEPLVSMEQCFSPFPGTGEQADNTHTPEIVFTLLH